MYPSPSATAHLFGPQQRLPLSSTSSPGIATPGQVSALTGQRQGAGNAPPSGEEDHGNSPSTVHSNLGMGDGHLTPLRNASQPQPSYLDIDKLIQMATSHADSSLAPSPLPFHLSSASGLSRPTSTVGNGRPMSSTPSYGSFGAGGPISSGGASGVVGDTRVCLFVGNLPFRVRWQDVKDLFRRAGTVLRADVSLGSDNRSKGHGLVLLGSREDAIRAIEMFNGYNWQTRILEVRPERLPPEFEQHAPPLQHVPPPQHTSSHSNAPSNLSSTSPPLYPSNSNLHHPIPGLGSASAASMLYNHTSQSQLSVDNRRSNSPFGSRLGSSTSSPSPLIPSAARASSSPSLSHLNSQGSFASSNSGMSPTLRVSSNRSGTPKPNVNAMLALEEAVSKSLRISSSEPLSKSGRMQTPASSSGLSLSKLGHESLATYPDQASPTSAIGKTLFVGNLPFHIQWQDLKDLFRTAGNISRADVAQGPDGRSKGFGSVVFGSEVDALNALTMFDGYEMNGRKLQVYPEQLNPSQLASHLSQYTASAAFHSTQSRQLQQPFMAQRYDLPSPLHGPHSPLYPPQVSYPAAYSGHQIGGYFPQFTTQYPSISSAVQNAVYAAPAGNQSSNRSAPSTLPPSAHLPSNNGNGNQMFAFSTGQQAAPSFQQQQQQQQPPPQQEEQKQQQLHRANAPHPGRIVLPPAYPVFSQHPMMSPVQNPRGMPLLTPSMPSFQFNAFPTPPLFPQFLSPGLGPMSPPLHSPPIYHPYLNPAPGAPILFPTNVTPGNGPLNTYHPDMNHNPMFPPMTPSGFTPMHTRMETPGSIYFGGGAGGSNGMSLGLNGMANVVGFGSMHVIEEGAKNVGSSDSTGKEPQLGGYPFPVLSDDAVGAGEGWSKADEEKEEEQGRLMVDGEGRSGNGSAVSESGQDDSRSDGDVQEARPFSVRERRNSEGVLG